MGACLVSLDGEADIPLDRVPTLVGRHPSCDARIDSARISRRHCCLAPDGAGVGVRDLGSTNGTRINGHRVESGKLGPGDELAIAQFRYRLVVGESRPEVGLFYRGQPAKDPRYKRVAAENDFFMAEDFAKALGRLPAI